jgi:DNA-binding GntR family transcriptional regulator
MLGLGGRPGSGQKLARSVYSGPILGELRAAIISRRLQKSTRLVEQRLASDFGVSRGPIRSALLALEAEGLVRSLPSGGMVVTGFDVADLTSLFAVRHVLESTAVHWGVDAGTDPAPVTAALADFKAHARGSARSLVTKDITFHRKIVEFGQSRFLLQAWNSLAPVLETAIAVGNDALSGDGEGGRLSANDHTRIYRAHIEIAEAIAQGDPDRVSALLQKQFAEAERSLRCYYASAAELRDAADAALDA